MSKTPATDHYQDRHDEHDYDDDPGDCWHCGGEGFIADCFDGFCEAAEYGCEDCTRQCPECARPKPSSDEMRRVLAEALEQANGPPTTIPPTGNVDGEQS